MGEVTPPLRMARLKAGCLQQEDLSYSHLSTCAWGKEGYALATLFIPAPHQSFAALAYPPGSRSDA